MYGKTDGHIEYSIQRYRIMKYITYCIRGFSKFHQGEGAGPGPKLCVFWSSTFSNFTDRRGTIGTPSANSVEFTSDVHRGSTLIT